MLIYNHLSMKLTGAVTSNWPILLLLFATAIIHLWPVGNLTTFSGDQGYDFLNIKEILEGNLTLLGPRIGPYTDKATLYLGPFYYFLLAPFLAIWRLDPIGASYAIVASRLLTVLLVYLIVRKVATKQAAIISSAVAAISPLWANSLGFPSNPYFIPPIILLVILLLLSKKKTLITYVAVGFLIGLSLQLHYLSIVAIPALLSYLWISKSDSKLKNIPSLFLGIIVALSPVILFELRNKFFLTNQFFTLLRSGSFTPNLNTILILPFFAILSLLVFKKLPKVNREFGSFCLTLVVLNVLVFLLYPGDKQLHYLANAYPVLLILAGPAIYYSRQINKFLPALITIFIVIVLFKSNNFFATSGYTMPEDLNLRQIKNLSKLIAADVGGESFNITSTLDGDSRAMPYRYLSEIYAKIPQGVEHYDTPQNLYIITRDPANSIRENPLFEIASFQPSYVENVWYANGDIKLIKLSKEQTEKPQSPKFITIVNPVRPRNLWNDQSINVIGSQLKQINDRNLKATWLISYENLSDDELTSLFKSQNHEIGAFLEVSEIWATDSRVGYKIADGDYYRPDKVFLSGYSPQDRKKLIETYFKKFNEVFAYTPKSVGAWYIDAGSQEFLSEHGVTSALTVSDQFDTDAASIWGKYWAMPFYPSKASTLEPAKSQAEKLPIVNIQWAQRDLVAGYGKQIKDSRQSFQANDYVNNGYDTNYFTALMDNYLANAQNNDFMQITIGLEAAQEAQRFKSEFAKQLDIVAQKQRSESVNVVTLTDFAAWYSEKYPGISPSHLLKDGDNFWYMSPKFRAVVTKDADYQIKDLKYYQGSIFEDYYAKDNEPYLKRNVPALVDFVAYGTQINLGAADKLKLQENFDRLTLKLDNRLVQINTKGVAQDGNFIATRQVKGYRKSHQKRVFLVKTKEVISSVLNIFKYSSINGQKILGLSPDGSTIVGFRDFVPGVYKYDFQLAARFLSPARIIEKWQP